MADNNEILASVQVKVKADASDVLDSLKEIQQLLKNQVFKVQIESDVSGILNELKVISSTLHSLFSKPIDVKMNINEAKEAMALLQKEIQVGTKKGADAAAKAFNTLPKAVQNRAKSMSKELSSAFKGIEFSKVTTSMSKEVDRLNKQYQALYQTSDKLTTSWTYDGNNGLLLTLKDAEKVIGSVRYSMHTLSDGSTIYALDKNLTGAMSNAASKIDALIAKYERLKDSISKSNLGDHAQSTLINQIDNEIAALNRQKEAFYTSASAMKEYNSSFLSTQKSFTNQKSAIVKQAQDEAKAAKEIELAKKRALEAQQEMNSLYNRMESYMASNKRGEGFGNTDSLRARAKAMNEELSNISRLSETEQTEWRRKIGSLGNAWELSTIQMKNANMTGSDVLTNLTNKARTLGTYLMTSLTFMYVTQGVKSLAKEVTELDTAFTELRKTTDGSSQDYSNFMTDARKVADTVGRTTSEITQAAAEWSRSGYTLKESLPLGEASAMYTNISEYDNVSDATTSLIATMKAYGLEASNVTSILDKFNAVGNTTSTTSQGLGDAVQRAGSALAAAGNTLDESLGLIVAGNNALQDSSKVGNGLKTIAMRLRNTKGQIGELDSDIDTDGMVDSVTKLQNQLLNLTNGRVNIMDMNGQFRSTYDILTDLAGVWNQLDSVQQANITTLVAGTTQANLFNSIMSNLATDGAQAVTTALNSQGSAAAENAKYMDSIQGRMANLKSSWQSFASTMLSTDLIKGSLSGLTGLVDGLTTVVDKVGALPSLLGVLGIGATVKNLGALKGIGTVFADIQKFRNNDIGLTELKSTADVLSKMPKWSQSFVKAAPTFKTLSTEAQAAATGVTAIEAASAAATAEASGLGAALSGIGAVALPLAAVAVGVGIIGMAIKQAYDHAHRFDIALQKSQDSTSSYSNTVSELDTVNGSLAETQNKIKELQALSAQGGLSLADEAELNALQRQNAELERRKSILETTATLQQAQAFSDALAASKETTTTYNSDIIEGRMIGTLSDEEAKTPGKQKLNAAELLDQYTKKYADAKTQYDSAVDKLNNLGKDATDKQRESALSDVSKAQDVLTSAQNDLVAQQSIVQGLYDSLKLGEGTPLFNNDAKRQLDDYRIALDKADSAVNQYSKSEKDFREVSSFFNSGSIDRSNLKNYVLDKVINDGAKAFDVLQQLGLSLDTMGISSQSGLNRFFDDLAKQAETANKSLQKVDGTLSGMKEAAESTNTGDSFKEVGDFLESAKELQKQGLIGTDDFKTVAKFIDPDQKNYVKDFTDNYDKLQKYFTKDDDGNWTRKGIDNFVSALSDSEKQFKNTQEVADELGISTRAVEAIMDRMGDYGLKKLGNGQNVKDIKRVAGAYDEATSSLEQLKAVRDGMQHGRTRDALTKEIENFEKALDGDLSKFDPTIAVKIKAELDEAEIKSRIAELYTKVYKLGNGDEETRAELNVSEYQLKQTQEANLGWDNKKVRKSIPKEYKAMEDSVLTLGERLTTETDAGMRQSIQNAQYQLMSAQKNIRQAFENANPDVDFSDRDATSKALKDWKNSDEGKQIIQDQVAKLKLEPELVDVAESIANLTDEQKIQLGFEADASAEEILNQLIGETVEIDAKANVDEVDSTATDGQAIEMSTKAVVDSVDTSEVDSDPQVTNLSMTGKVDSVESPDASDTEFSGTLTVDQFEADNPTIEATADVSDVETPDDVEIQIDAEGSAEEAIGQITEQLSGIPKETVIDMLATGNASTEALEVASSISGIPTSTLTQINATDGASGVLSTVLSQVTGIPETKWVQILAQGNAEQVAAAASEALSVIPPAKNVSITADGNAQSESQTAQGAVENIPDSHNTVLSATGNAISQARAAAAAIYAIPRSRSSIITVTRRNITINETRSKAAGTAFAQGAAYARGSGNWGVGKDTTALVNEIGRRICDLAW